MKSYFLAMALWLGPPVFDQPPCWCPFRVPSANKQFVAHVKKADADSARQRWEATWELSVFRKKSVGDSTLLWKSRYAYDGYPEGILSDDGRTFAYVNYWYRENAEVVAIYQEGRRTGSLPGKAFGLAPQKLAQTASHRRWLSQAGRAYEFTPATPYLLKVVTIDERPHLIDCTTGQLK